MRYIQIKTQFIGFHRWDDAFKEVAFLKNLHRHLFIVKVKMQVFYDNREVEFFTLQKQVKGWVSKQKLSQRDNLGSCEHIAQSLLTFLEPKYPKRFIEVSVSEDGENEGIVDNIVKSRI